MHQEWTTDFSSKSKSTPKQWRLQHFLLNLNHFILQYFFIFEIFFCQMVFPKASNALKKWKKVFSKKNENEKNVERWKTHLLNNQIVKCYLWVEKNRRFFWSMPMAVSNEFDQNYPSFISFLIWNEKKIKNKMK